VESLYHNVILLGIVEKEYDFSKGIRGKYAKKYRADLKKNMTLNKKQKITLLAGLAVLFIIFVYPSVYITDLESRGIFDEEIDTVLLITQTIATIIATLFFLIIFKSKEPPVK
jgi:hypothetical protein